MTTAEKRGFKKQTSAVYEEIEPIVKNPLCCGFLKEFCNQQFNVESLQFIMEVEALNSTMKIDLNSWPLTWKEIDSEICKEKGLSSFDEVIEQEKISPTVYPWPSKQVNQETVRTDLQEIWDTFISNDKATLQICLPNSVLRTTKFRFDHFQRYGPTVFMEATIDPALTLCRDILPRFQKTSKYQKMNEMLTDLQINNGPNDLIVPPPNYPLKPLPIDNPEHEYTLEETISHPLLYSHFLDYLLIKISTENLLCLRLILLYEEQFQNNKLSQAAETAYKIYKFFLLPNSPYQISLTSQQFRVISYCLATPSLTMFTPLKSSLRCGLMQLYDSGYKRTEKYQQSYQLLLQDHQERERKRGGVFFWCCFCCLTPKISSS